MRHHIPVQVSKAPGAPPQTNPTCLQGTLEPLSPAFCGSEHQGKIKSETKTKCIPLFLTSSLPVLSIAIEELVAALRMLQVLKHKAETVFLTRQSAQLISKKHNSYSTTQSKLEHGHRNIKQRGITTRITNITHIPETACRKIT